MDPMMLMMIMRGLQQASQPQQPTVPGAGQPAPAPPVVQPATYIPSDQGGAPAAAPPGGVALGEGAAPQDGGAFSPGAAPAAAPAASPLAGLSNLGDAVTEDDIAIGQSLLGGPPVSTTGQGMPPGMDPNTAQPELSGLTGGQVGTALDPSVAETGMMVAPPVAPPTQKPAGADMKSFLSGLGGVKAPPPVTPIMHGGNTGGARAPEVSAKMGSSVALNPILQMLFGGGHRQAGLPVPALGQLLRGA